MPMYSSDPNIYGDITLLELVPLCLRFLRLGVTLVCKALLYPISGRTHSFKRTLWRTFVQTMCPNSTLRQMQWVSPRVSVLYEKFIHDSGHLEIVHDIIDEGASLHWIGSKSSKQIILFFHGGGYVLPAVDGHFLMVDYWRRQVKKRHDVDISIVVLEYSLVNFAPWPQQLRQVVAALLHLLKSGFEPSDIILAGDSVGGHQVAFLLAHLLHPHPAAPPIPTLSTPFAGAVMLSPWLTFSDASRSFTLNAATDLMPTPTLRKWGDLLKQSRQATGTTNDGNWFEPAEAPADWWNGLDKVVNDVLFTTGSGECMFDDIVATGRRVAEGAGKSLKVETFVQEGAAHNEVFVEFACGDKHGSTTEKVTAWIADIFAT